MIIMVKHDTIVISVEKIYIMLSLKFIFNLVTVSFVAFLENELDSKYEYKEESVTVQRTITLTSVLDHLLMNTSCLLLTLAKYFILSSIYCNILNLLLLPHRFGFMEVKLGKLYDFEPRLILESGRISALSGVICCQCSG